MLVRGGSFGVTLYLVTKDASILIDQMVESATVAIEGYLFLSIVPSQGVMED